MNDPPEIPMKPPFKIPWRAWIHISWSHGNWTLGGAPSVAMKVSGTPLAEGVRQTSRQSSQLRWVNRTCNGHRHNGHQVTTTAPTGPSDYPAWCHCCHMVSWKIPRLNGGFFIRKWWILDFYGPFSIAMFDDTGGLQIEWSNDSLVRQILGWIWFLSNYSIAMTRL